MSISNELNKQPSIFEIVTKTCSIREVFRSVKKLFRAPFRESDSNLNFTSYYRKLSLAKFTFYTLMPFKYSTKLQKVFIP